MQKNELTDDLLSLGVRPEGVLMVHSSLKALGPVEGGAETVIVGLLEALGGSGTLLMPALTYERVTAEQPLFDVKRTPGNVGLIPETFRLRAGTKRSLHPTHSVCATGPQATELLEAHLQDDTPCGAHSPFHRLPEFGGQILMLGCGLEPNTSMHAIEELVVPPYLYGPPGEYQLVLQDGTIMRKTYIPHNFHGWVQRYDRVGEILSSPGLRRGRVLQAEAFIIEAAALWEKALEALKRDPCYFVDRVA
jgi:aminoglycoside 3-N-acetyltransferase